MPLIPVSGGRNWWISEFEASKDYIVRLSQKQKTNDEKIHKTFLLSQEYVILVEEVQQRLFNRSFRREVRSGGLKYSSL